MTNSSILFRKLLMSFAGSLVLFAANAQRIHERPRQNDNRERDRGTFHNQPRPNNEERMNPQRVPPGRPQRYEPVTRNDDRRREAPAPFHRNPDTRDRPPGYNPQPNPAFRERRVRVAPAPQYAYYDNSYRHHYYHAPVYNAHNPCWRYSYLPARRTVITAFPFAYQTINYGGCGYRFYNGTFYRPYNSAFIVVAPPVGLSINILPFGYRRLYVDNATYYYYNGTYYNDYDDGYRVVAPPVGAVVESIPQGYETVNIDGETYYVADGVQYKPEVQENGEIWYRVIKVS